MLVLRKGKKTIKAYIEPYEIADDVETLRSVIPAESIARVQRFIRQNAFSFAIIGCKARLGNGVILEQAH